MLGTQNEIRRKNIVPPSNYVSMKAWQIALQDPFGTLEDQYSFLPSLQKEIQKVDLDGLCLLELKELTFQRFFYSPGASKDFINLQRPLVSADAGWLKSDSHGRPFLFMLKIYLTVFQEICSCYVLRIWRDSKSA